MLRAAIWSWANGSRWPVTRPVSASTLQTWLLVVTHHRGAAVVSRNTFTPTAPPYCQGITPVTTVWFGVKQIIGCVPIGSGATSLQVRQHRGLSARASEKRG